MNKLNNELKIQKDELRVLYILESILLYNSLYTKLLNQYAKDTTLLLNIITNAHKGHIDPQIIKPSKLLAQLKDIKTNLPSNLNLPIEINAKN
ncbi:Envelope fusion protein [Aphis craccivora]|uniref:Envelope fusion protein n=1 Tax=Aphis craccivora TaxID=307492 RepID=A0A6G0ZQ39_APHCR|nr:Envelope fusion protein [Aphis craccivora]